MPHPQPLRRNPPKDQLQPVDALYRAGRYTDTLAAVNNLLAGFPQAPILRFVQGLAQARLGQYDAAITAYKQALALAPDLAEAQYNMARIHKTKGDLPTAITCYRAALRSKPTHQRSLFNLGNALQGSGDLSGALSSYRKLLELNPKHVKGCTALGGLYLEVGNRDAAIAHYQKALALDPDHEAARHLLAAVQGDTPAAAPRSYVENLFDDYAQSFETSLVDGLDYRTPAQVAAALIALRPDGTLGRVLDLGCGTGLSGAALQGRAEHLTGVDLSQGMLKEAHKKNVYDALLHEDLLEHLGQTDLDYDCVLAMDVLIYLGDLEPVFRLLASRTRRPVHLAFSTEHNPSESQTGYSLRLSGRYAHSRVYIDGLAARFGYVSEHFSVVRLRKEKGDYLQGGIYVFACAPSEVS